MSRHADSSILPKCFGKKRWTDLSVFDFSRKLFYNKGEAGPRL